MEEKEVKNKPIKKFRAGAVTATIWSNPSKEGDSEYHTISFERRYKDKDDNWKSTNSLRASDLPRSILVLSKAYEFITLTEEASQGL